ncbi:MAG: DUF3142 domain-containing protein [Sedimentisphaerales bacterium]|nr:DUF3142 domain-containing protein [Sedimentisphaerales bacterium]
MRLSPRRKSVSSLILSTIAVAAIVLGLVYLAADSLIRVERRSGPMLHEAYVWQRNWDTAVGEAVERAAGSISGFTALAAEVSFKAARIDKVVRVEIDYDALLAAKSTVGLALRIGPYSGPFDEENDVTRILVDLAGSLLADARQAGLKPVELQIDFDCAESKLDGYARWVGAFRNQIKPVPVVVTALPSWLNCRAFKHLSQTSNGFVLQAHSLDRPKGPDASMTLCDGTSALRWVERAARFAVPFRVALPTYGYIVAFDKAGEFVGLSAEGPSRSWAEPTTLRAVRSDPIAMAGLVQKWQDSRPANMQGIIWYRLPVETDQLNWKWVTLTAVMAGRSPQGALQILVEYPEDPNRELVELAVQNSGNADLSPMMRLNIECDRTNLLASDGLRGFALIESGPGGLSLEYKDPKPLAVLAPGEQWKIGWLRFKQETEVKVNAAELP